MFQYYEMSYGLNVEMHKQVCTLLLLLFDCDILYVARTQLE